MKSVFALLFLSLCTLETIQAQETVDSLATKELVAAKEYVDLASYKMEVPPTWKIKTGCVNDQCTIISLRDTLGGYDTYIESINFTINKLSSSKYTAKMYADFSIGYLPKVVKNFQLLEKKMLKSNVYRITYRGEKNALLQTWKQYYYVKNAKVHIVTFSAETRKYDIYQPMIEPYLNTFVLK